MLEKISQKQIAIACLDFSLMLRAVILSLMFFHYYAGCRYAECHHAECHYAEHHYAECHYAERHYAERRYA
jgi:hypothetical protein